MYFYTFALLRMVILILLGVRIVISWRINIEWTNHITLADGMELKWVSTDPTWITMEMSARTKGYLGIGISPHGGMAGSDIALGWVDVNGRPHFKDYHGTLNGPPVEDTYQNYELLYAAEDDEKTKIIFRRKWVTCDARNDQPIADKPLKLIWAWHPNDPKLDYLLHWHGNGSGRRGVRNMSFKSSALPALQFPHDSSNETTMDYVDFTMYNVRLSQNYNSQCKVFKFPAVMKKRQIIGYRPIIISKHQSLIRQMTLKMCKVPMRFGRTQDFFEKYVRMSSQICYEKSTPRDWVQYCVTSLITYAIGGTGVMMPGNVGFPIQPGESYYVLLEIKYEKIDWRTQYTLDNSGFRVFYSPKLRRYDAAVLQVGHRRTPFLTIPPNQRRFLISGFCSAKCTRLGFREMGIRMFAVLLHGHATTRTIKLKHIRKGHELAIIAQEHYYDYNYEEYVILPKEVAFFPEDELILECVYNTNNKSSVTFGGPLPGNEMCEAYILYYPRSALSDCRSQPEFGSYLKPLGIGALDGAAVQKLGLPYSSEQSSDTGPAQPDDSDLIAFGHSFSDSIDLLNTIEIINSTFSSTPLNFLNYLSTISSVSFLKLDMEWGNGSQYVFCSDQEGYGFPNQPEITHITKYTRRVEEISSCEKLEGEQNIGSLFWRNGKLSDILLTLRSVLMFCTVAVQLMAI